MTASAVGAIQLRMGRIADRKWLLVVPMTRSIGDSDRDNMECGAGSFSPVPGYCHLDDREQSFVVTMSCVLNHSMGRMGRAFTRGGVAEQRLNAADESRGRVEEKRLAPFSKQLLVCRCRFGQ